MRDFARRIRLLAFVDLTEEAGSCCRTATDEQYRLQPTEYKLYLLLLL